MDEPYDPGPISENYPGLSSHVMWIDHAFDLRAFPRIHITQYPLVPPDETVLESHSLLMVTDSENHCPPSPWKYRGLAADVIVDKVTRTSPGHVYAAISRHHVGWQTLSLILQGSCLVVMTRQWTPDAGQAAKLITMAPWRPGDPLGPIALYGPALHEWVMRDVALKSQARQQRGEFNQPWDGYVPDRIDLLYAGRVHTIRLEAEDVTLPPLGEHDFSITAAKFEPLCPQLVEAGVGEIASRGGGDLSVDVDGGDLPGQFG